MIRPAPLTCSPEVQDRPAVSGAPIPRWALPLLLLLALLHGLQYATLLPPWGLIDEAQHVDYVWHIAARGDLPVAGATTLAPELIDSLFATRHWFVFHWSTPPSPAVADLGAGGYSYEAYHPPLYYLLLALPYLAAPGSILDRLFVLRVVTVALSLVTVYLCFRLASLVSGSTLLALLAALVLIMLPERTATVSRVNNDALAELLGAAICLAAAQGAFHSLTRPRAVALGLLLVLGVWTKLSVAFWLGPLAVLAFWLYPRPDGRRWLLPLLLGGGALAALLARNWSLYQDLTGFSAFHKLYPLVPPPLLPATFLGGIADLFRHFWFIWWKGAQVGSTPLTAALYGVLAALALVSAALLVRALWRRRRVLRRSWRTNPRLAVFVFFALAAGTYALMALYTYFQGIVPVLQGRFLAPATVVYVLLYAYGWWQHRLGVELLLLTAVGLFFVSVLVLWGNLLPYHYYWSSVNASLAELPSGASAAVLFWSNLAADKPRILLPLLPLLVAACWLAAAFTFYWTWRWRAAARRTAACRASVPATGS